MPEPKKKTVDRSSSEISRRWMRAVPSALSVNTTTKPAKTSTIAASPQSCGVSTRARKRATTIRASCSVSCELAFQTIPLRMRLPRESGAGVMLRRGRPCARRQPVRYSRRSAASAPALGVTSRRARPSTSASASLSGSSTSVTRPAAANRRPSCS